LAEEGHTVLLLEAGADPKSFGPDVGRRLRRSSLHPNATENADVRWDFFVRHYTDDTQQKKDPKYRETWNGRPANGVFYPRTGTLGGCTAHNAMILVYPHDWDWDQVADLTGDSSWDPGQMRTYFERIENCHHRRFDARDQQLGFNPSRHGYGGWLHTETAAADRRAARQRPSPRAEGIGARRRSRTKRSARRFRLGKLTDVRAIRTTGA
jgi:choline dehydrogenase-like flavoprotein